MKVESITYPRVTMRDFGKDHWSLLGYVFTSCQNGNQGVGQLQPERMSCCRLRESQRIYPRGNYAMDPNGWEKSWGTRLKGFFVTDGVDLNRQLPYHDDFECLLDLEEAGLVNWISVPNMFVRLTPFGLKVGGALMIFKAGGGNFAEFDGSEFFDQSESFSKGGSMERMDE